MNKTDAGNALIEMGMSPALSGFKYIMASVEKLDTPEWENGKITQIYVQIAKENNSTGIRVERAIRHAFEVIREKGNTDCVHKYIGYENPTNSDSLKKLHLILKRESEWKKENLLFLTENVINKNAEKQLEKLIEVINKAVRDYFSSLQPTT